MIWSLLPFFFRVIRRNIGIDAFCQGGLRSGDIVALEGTRRLGFRLIGRRPDQPGSLRARYSPGAILDDVFENGEDRSLAVGLDGVRRKGRLVVRVPGLSCRRQDAGRRPLWRISIGGSFSDGRYA